MKSQKIAFVFSNVIDSPIYRGLLDEFSKSEFRLSCLFMGLETDPLYRYARRCGIDSRQITSISKRNFVFPLLTTMWWMFRKQPRSIITFGQTASVMGLSSAFLTCRATRIYLRMHSSMNRVEKFSRGVLYDRISNMFAQKIIVPNRNTRSFLESIEKVASEKIIEIAFGFNLEDFKSPSKVRVQAIRHEYELSPEKFILGIVSRYSPVKGLEYSLPAVSKFLSKHPNGVLVLVGTGESPPKELLDAVSDIMPSQLRMIPRVDDMAAFYKCLSVFVHTPIDETVESFGLVYIEAFAAGVPSVITLSGIAKEIAVDGENCLVVDYCSELEIENAVEKLFNRDDLRETFSSNAVACVSIFTLDAMRKKYRDLIVST